MAVRKLRVGVVGAGGIAVAQHIPAWLEVPAVEILAVADISREAAAAASQKFNIPHTFTDWRRLVAMEELDVVDVCTPNRFHGPVGVAALKAGKHVIVEKPMTATAAEARELVEAAGRANRKLMCAQHQRFTDEARALARYLARHPLGDIYYARAQAIRRRGLPPRPGFISRKQSGGGALLDIGVHILDLTWWLMGCPTPVSASAVVARKLAGRRLFNPWGPWDPAACDVEDFGVGFVRFQTGAVLTLETTWLANTGQSPFGCEIWGTEAGVTWPACQIFTEHNGVLVDTQLAQVKTTTKPHHEEIRCFAEAIRQDKPSPVPPEESLVVMEMLDAMYRSSRLGREVKVG